MAASPRPTRNAAAPAAARRGAGNPRGGRAAGGGGFFARLRGGLWRRLLALTAFPAQRWLAVLVCVAVLLIGVPLAHAMVGDLGALLLLVGLGGFALGRATAPRPAFSGGARGAARRARPRAARQP